MTGSNCILRLDVVSDGQVVFSETVDQDKAKVGTLGSSTLRLNQPGVSTIHAVIERQGPDTFLLSDLGSAAGTYVNGSRVQRHILADGDQIYFGDALVVANLIDPSLLQPAHAHAAPAPGPSTFGGQIPAQITLADGTVVVPYGDSGYYDNDGNYIPGYYDEAGEYHLGYGYVGENGEWVVVFGYYDANGDWVDTDEPVSSVAKSDSNWRFDGISDKRVFTESYFANQGGDTIEIAQIWEDSVLSVTNFKDGDVVTISSDPNSKASYVLEDPSLTSDPFTLLDAAGTPCIYVSNKMTALICKNGQEFTLEQALAQNVARQQGNLFAIPFDNRTSASIDIGEVTFVLHYTRIPAVVLIGPSFDYAQLGFYAASFAIHILFLLLILTVPPNSDALNLDGFGVDDRYAQLLVQAQEEEKPEVPDYLTGDGDDGGAEDEKPSQDSGGGGDYDGPVDDTLPADATEEQIALKRAHDTNVAQNAGIASAFAGGAMGGVFGTGSGAVGSGAMTAIGAITDSGGAAGVADAGGFGAFGGVASAGRGGVGAGERGLSAGGGIGTLGRGGGGGKGGSGYGKGAADGRLREKRNLMPRIVPGKPEVRGSLDREIIKRVIRQHRNEIKYCYEQQLQKDPSLAGRVTVSFTIAASGNVIVAKIASSTLKNAAVENCITGKIRRWVFPEPKGGGIARVNYPFNFSH